MCDVVVSKDSLFHPIFQTLSTVFWLEVQRVCVVVRRGWWCACHSAWDGTVSIARWSLFPVLIDGLRNSDYKNSNTLQTSHPWEIRRLFKHQLHVKSLLLQRNFIINRRRQEERNRWQSGRGRWETNGRPIEYRHVRRSSPGRWI